MKLNLLMLFIQQHKNISGGWIKSLQDAEDNCGEWVNSLQDTVDNWGGWIQSKLFDAMNNPTKNCMFEFVKSTGNE